MSNDYQEELQKKQMEALKKTVLLKFMTKKARERLNRVKMVKPEMVEKIEISLIQAIQTGQIKNKISESQLINILKEINENKKYNILK